MAALIDGMLSGEERDRLLGHLAACDPCRETFIMARTLAEVPDVKGSRRSRILIPGALAAAACIILALVVTVRKPPEQGERVALSVPTPSPAPQVAKAPAAVTPPASPGKRSHAPVLAVVALVTEKEALLPDPPRLGFIQRLKQDGPELAVVSPGSDEEQGGAFPLVVTFTPRDGAAVEPSSIRLHYVKEQPLDLTPRLAGHMSETGIDMQNVKLPPGLHRFRLTVSDVNGRLSQRDLMIRVAYDF